MSPLRTSVGATAALLGVGLAAACGSGGGPAVRQSKGVVRPVAAVDPLPYTHSDAAFGFNLLRAWCQTMPSSNVVLSPSSLSSGLGMAFLGARGGTATAMAKALNLPDPQTTPQDQLLGGLKARSNALNAVAGEGGGDKPVVRRVDQVWADSSLPPENAYLDAVATAYQAKLNSLKILSDPEAARGTINSAISDATKGMVPALLPKDSLKDIGWVFTDATYLKAHWDSPFKKDDTRSGPFTTASGQQVQTPFMTQGHTLGYAKIPGWTAVALPYSSSTLEMDALLPDDSGAQCPDLTADTLGTLTSRMQPTKLRISLPKSKLSSHRNVKDLLTELGMGPAFSQGADFTALSPHSGPIRFVQHAAVLKVDEDGTEGAAATAGGNAAMAAPMPLGTQITFDRPYVIVVRDSRSGEPLFLGRVADPRQGG